MANRLKKEDYISEEAKELKERFNSTIKIDKERALAQRIVDKIPQERKQFVLEILSRELASK